MEEAERQIDLPHASKEAMAVPEASILTGWVRGCGDSVPAQPSRPVPRRPRLALPACCPDLCH